MTLAQNVSKALVDAIASASGEVAIIKQFIANIAGLKKSPGVIIQTAFCHQKPYAFFVNPIQYANRQKCELGDILWVYKTLSRGTVTDHRATFSQAKHSNSSTFHIEEHQYKFLIDINSNSFQFGSTVYGSTGYRPRVFKAVTKSKHFSNYLFINPSLTPKCECTNNLILSTPTLINTIAMQSFEQYIDSFFLPKSFGMNLDTNKDGWELVDIVFKRLALVLDPPEEWKGYFEEDKSGFGVVFITVSQE
jgi:hypothetical protein